MTRDSCRLHGNSFQDSCASVLYFIITTTYSGTSPLTNMGNYSSFTSLIDHNFVICWWVGQLLFRAQLLACVHIQFIPLL